MRDVAVELGLEIDVADMRLRGIIDRLDLTESGELVVIDYKTGRAPSERFERGRLSGVHIYALLCERVLGRLPVEVRLLHLRDPVAITAVPTEQSLRGHRQRTLAVWQAIERACARDDFRPRPGASASSATSRTCARRSAANCRSRWPLDVVPDDRGPAGPAGADQPTGWPPAVDRFDAGVERLFDRLRGQPVPDTTAAVVSNLGDYGAIWVALAALKGRHRGPRRVLVVRRLALAGFGSSAVNTAAKRLVAGDGPSGPSRASGSW